MHKKITKAITDALSYRDDKILSFETERKLTDGFWKLKVRVKRGNVHKLKQIEIVGKEIGRFYGEELYIVRMKHCVVFS